MSEGRSLGAIDGKRLYVGPCPGRKRPVVAMLEGGTMWVLGSFSTPENAAEVIAFFDSMNGAIITEAPDGE